MRVSGAEDLDSEPAAQGTTATSSRVNGFIALTLDDPARA